MTPDRNAPMKVDEMNQATYLLLDLPMKIVSEANRRDHWGAKMKRRQAQQWELEIEWRDANGHRPFQLPCRVRFVRTGPKLLDDDNLRSSLKSVRDQVAKLLGTHDAPDAPVTWLYDQIAVGTHDYSLRIEVESDIIEKPKSPEPPRDLRSQTRTLGKVLG